MTLVEELAAFVVRAGWDDLDPPARDALKLRVLDSLGCAIGALRARPIAAVREQLADFGGRPLCTLIGGGRSAPDRAALHNGALVRYLDFNDSYLAPRETCHPSDNLAPVLAACEYAAASGRELLTALAVAYQVQCRLSEAAPVRDLGFDHTTQGAFAVAAGVAKALRLDARRTAHAIAISGTALPALRVTRTGELSEWKGLAYPHTAFAATHAAFLASRGVTGPREVFEGAKGFMETISGPFEIDWSREGLDRAPKTDLKRYDAEIHAQSTIEALLDLRGEERIPPEDVAGVEIDVFDVAHLIIGGGAEGEKQTVRTKEQADHSLPYMAAAALLDGQLLPEQYAEARIARPDVQDLLRRVTVRPAPDLSRRFPSEHPSRVRVRLRDGRALGKEKRDYEGFHTRPMRRETVLAKAARLAVAVADADDVGLVASAVANLDVVTVAELCTQLARIAPAQEEP